MTTTKLKHTLITLYTNGYYDPYSHIVKIVLAEKGVEFEEKLIKDNIKILPKLNPYCYTPVFVDKELTLYKVDIITEYIDERFPHPTLMPINPQLKAKTRLIIYRIDQEWFEVLNYIISVKYEFPETLNEYKRQLIAAIEEAKILFKEMPYFLSETFSIIDCWMATLLWFLHEIDPTFLKRDSSMYNYSRKIFARDSFQKALNRKV